MRAGVLAVVVAHPSGRWLDEVLGSLAAQTYPTEVVVAALGDVEVPREVRVVRLDAGAGFARAVNEALAAAGGEARYVLLLHDDAAPAPDAVAEMVALAEQDPSVGAVGAKLVEWDDPSLLQEVGIVLDRFAVRRPWVGPGEVDHGQHDDTGDVVCASDACLLVRAELLAGGLDPALWPGYEDVDLGWRIRAGGGRVVVATKARVRHAAAMARGLRPPADPLRAEIDAERGRLRFMLKRYEAATLAAILPQYAALVVGRLVAAAARRELWRVLCLGRAWAQVAADLPAIAEARARAGARVVRDAELLRLASRRARPAARLERLAAAGRLAEGLADLERRAGVLVRDPFTWAVVVAGAVVVAALAPALVAGPVRLGELRPLPTLREALAAYLARLRPAGLDAGAPAAPGIVLVGALRTLSAGRGGLAAKLLLVGPLVASALGARRLAAAAGLSLRGGRWFALASAVNPVTLALARAGRVGALLTWAATTVVAAATLSPRGGGTPRRLSRWALGWAAVAALHPPALLWLVAVGLAMGAAAGDRRAERLRMVGLGVGGAFVLNLPWSLEWLSPRCPLVGSWGFAAAPRGGLDAATFGVGWPLAAWSLVAAALAAAVPRRISAAAALLAAGAWAAGASGTLPPPTALAGVGWALTVLVAVGGAGTAEELRRRQLGWRHAAALGAAVATAAAWVGAGVTALLDPATVRPLGVVPTSREPAGRVLWLAPTQGGALFWATEGFDETLRSWPDPSGPADRLVAGALRDAQGGRTHRLGTLLSLAGVSHVVALDSRLARRFASQADLSVTETQAGGVIFRNESWRGPAILLPGPPLRPRTPPGLAQVAMAAGQLPASRLPAGLEVQVPADARGVVYLAVGNRGGWRVGGRPARPAAAGIWVPASDGPLRASSPGWPWRRVIQVMAGLLAGGLAGLWLVASYLAPPGRLRREAEPPASSLPGAEAAVRRWWLAAAGAAAAGAVAWAWGPGGAGGEGGLLSAAWYCPAAGEGVAQSVVIVNPSPRRASYLVRPGVGAAPSASGGLAGLRRTAVPVDPRSGVMVEAYGGRVVAASAATWEGGAAVVPCTPSPPRRVLFAEGGRSSMGGAATRTSFLVSNPFGAPARVRVRFFTAEESVAPPALQDLQVPPASGILVDPEAQLEPQEVLAAEVTVWQGRAVVARRLRRPGGLWWSAGLPALRAGVVPVAGTKDASTRLVAVNPSEAPARVTMEMTGAEGSLPRLAFDVAPRGREAFDLSGPAAGQEHLLVRVAADVPVGLDAVVIPAQRAAALVLAPAPAARGWALPVAEGRTLVLQNPGGDVARVSLRRLGPGPPLQPLRLAPGQVAAVALEGAGPFGVVVRASRPITAAVTGPGGAMAGIPLG